MADDKIYTSEDSGVTWTDNTPGDVGWSKVTIDNDGTNYMAATYNALFTGLNETKAKAVPSGTENNPVLTSLILEDMEKYPTDALARTAWDTSATDLVPPDLGLGTDGDKTVSANETLSGGTYNYTSLTIDAGIALTLTNTSVIKCLGTVTVNGTIDVTDGDIDIYAYILTIGAEGLIQCTGSKHYRANTISGDVNAGSTQLPIEADEHNSTGSLQEASGGATVPPEPTNFEASYDNNDITFFGTTHYRPGGGDWGMVSTLYSTHTWDTPVNLGKIWYKMRTWSTSAGNYPNGYMYQYVDIRYEGSNTWVNLYSYTYGQSDVTNDEEIVGVWNDVTGLRIRCVSAAGGDRDGWVSTAIYEIQGYASTICDYINGSGLPPSNNTSDFIAPLEVFSEGGSLVKTGSYSLRVTALAGAATLDEYIQKTIDEIDLSSYNKILVDIRALRTGTNIEFGIGTDSYEENPRDIIITEANTWETYELDYSTAGRTSIKKLGFKFINTDSPNIVYIDNIRPAITECTYLSPRFEINAQTMGYMYWNEVLTDYGDINFYTRSSDTESAFTDWTNDSDWSEALTNPSGSVITSDPKKYFQFKVVFTTTDETGKYFPYIYKANGYNIKFTYWKTKIIAETEVEFRYRTGWRNFDSPFDDKIFRKLVSFHEGNAGYFDIILECGMENTQTHEFESISLVTYPAKWYSTLPSTMYGKELRLEWYKNDTEDFKLRQFGLMVESIPLI